MQPDPDMQRFLDLLEVGAPFVPPGDVGAFRTLGARNRAKLSRLIDRPVESSEWTIETSWGAAALRIVRPREASPAAMLYFHGGGWSSGSNQTHRPVIEAYASMSRCVVVAVDYALAPEAPFPAALWQGLAALTWARTNAEKLGIEADKIAVGGDSAGANLALCLCLAARDLHLPMPPAMLLSYGSFDPEPSRRSYAEFGSDDYLLTPSKMRWFWDNYAPATLLSNPLVAPLKADLRGLPPTHLIIAGRDILRDENMAMAEALEAAGVSVTASLHQNAVHAFLEAVDFAEVSKRAVAEQAEWLSNLLAGRRGSRLSVRPHRKD